MSTRVFPLAVVMAAVLFAGCSSGGGAECASPGDACSVNGATGVCQTTGSEGCVPLCGGFFDSVSCAARPQSACYPVYRNKFGCVDVGPSPSGAGGSCIQNSDCRAQTACISRRCLAGCDASHPCPDGGGSCLDLKAYGWTVCKVVVQPVCNDSGDYCDFNGETGICAASGEEGCKRQCYGFFDMTSCMGLSGTACYPAYKEKFACLKINYPTKSSCEPCVNHNDCEPQMACQARYCRYGCDGSHPCEGKCEGICFDYSGYGWTVCGYFQPTACEKAGEECTISGKSGVCIAPGPQGCRLACTGFFDTASCLADVGTACYPAYQDKFACLAEGTANVGETCSVCNDCVKKMTCVGNKCVLGCDDSHECPVEGGVCTEISSGLGWRVCVH